MKRLTKLYLKTFFVCAFCFALFLTAGFYFLTPKTEKKVQNSTSSVSYASKPQNAGVLFEIAGECVYLYLDFENECINLLYPENNVADNNEIYGYPIDYRVEAGYEIAVEIIDSVDGIDLTLSDETLTYTGIQIKEILTTTVATDALKREITEKIIEKVSQSGFFRQDFLYIIENSETNLTIPVCYYWSDNIQTLCKNLRVIN